MTRISRSSDFTGAVDRFVTENEDWLTATEQTFITAMYQAANELDRQTGRKLSAAMLTELRLNTNEVIKRKPVSKTAIKEETEAQRDAFDELISDF
ncbi:hypothetical protein [Rhodococcus wratislaviensis]|uniref:hypothetical protein n=1 Tax=Rhodococcus wratislaviensis TaxID=44752 RepID=UPI0011BD4C48|nr:hypothetical protein [Rhodococcus wratislaviensis]